MKTDDELREIIDDAEWDQMYYCRTESECAAAAIRAEAARRELGNKEKK